MPSDKLWMPDRRDMIWMKRTPMPVFSPKAFNARNAIVIGLPMTHAPSNQTNPFAIKFTTEKGEVCYVLTHQPISLDWRNRGARPHPWKQVPAPLFEAAREPLNGIIAIG